MRLQIKQKKEMSRQDIPILSYTRDMLKTTGSGDMLDNSFFAADLEEDQDYAVMDLGDYQRMSPESQRKMWALCEEMDLQGNESRHRLEAALSACDISSIDSAVDWIQEAYVQEADADDEAYFRDRLEQADEQMEEQGYSTVFEDLLHDENVCTPLHSEKHLGFDELPLLDDEGLVGLIEVRMPVYVVVDVSRSMLEEERYLFSRQIVTRIRQYLLTHKMTDDVRAVIYSSVPVEINIEDDHLIRPRSATATGSALEFVGGLIRERHPDEPVYVALVTDGQPTAGGQVEERQLEAQEYAEAMARNLPPDARLVQFALAPIDPADTEAFEGYIRSIYRITEESPYGQTVVLLRRREESLACLVLGGHQKIKQVQLLGETKG